jgi:hypothetical protein
MLKSDIRAALENGQISIDTYDDALRMLDKDEQESPHENIVPEYTLPP